MNKRNLKRALLLSVPIFVFVVMWPIARERRRIALTQKFLREIRFNGNIEKTKNFISQGVDVNGTIRGEYGKEGTTALHLLAYNGDREPEIKLLLENGANINARDVLGQTPLMKAVCGNISTVKFLVANEADLNIQTDPKDGYGHFILRGQTALTIAKRYMKSKDAKNFKLESQMKETIHILEAAGAKE